MALMAFRRAGQALRRFGRKATATKGRSAISGGVGGSILGLDVPLIGEGGALRGGSGGQPQGGGSTTLVLLAALAGAFIWIMREE